MAAAQAIRRRIPGIVCCAVLFTLYAPVRAGIIFPPAGPPSATPTVTIATAGETTYEFTPAPGLFIASQQTQSWNLGSSHAASHILGGKADAVIQQLSFNTDPFVLNNILITNTTTSTQIFTVGVALPTAFGAPNLISGNISATVIDGGTDGATVSSVTGFPIYSAQIDFAQVASLQPDPFTLTAPAGSNNNASASFGPTLSAVPVASNIGIQLRFSLTPGDTASILSRFDVVVPEPASAGVFAVAMLLLPRARRRTSSK